MEAGIGWPIPIQRRHPDDDPAAPPRMYLKLVCFRYERASGEERETATAVVYPPHTTITLDWKTGRPVEYVDLNYLNPAPELDWKERVGTFPHEAVQGPTSKYLADKARLFELYDALSAALEAGSAPPPDWQDEFSGLLSRLIEPGLVPYYRAIAPKFCERFLNQRAATGVGSG
jgi:hypothetical protein